MKLLDLTGHYCRTVVSAGTWLEYEQNYPALFRHYFRFWAKRSYPDVEIPVDMLLARSKLIERRLPGILRKFHARGFDTSILSIVLFVGKGCTNGHALRGEDKWTVWIPVETYATAFLVDVFVTHEIAHALHYAQSPKFYFGTKSERKSFSRQLLTEGIATYLAAEVLGCSDDTALWGGFLSDKQLLSWRADCERMWPTLLSIAARRFGSHAATEIFQANDPSSVLKFRAGYLLGLALIRDIAKSRGLSVRELIALPRHRLEQFAKSSLARGL